MSAPECTGPPVQELPDLPDLLPGSSAAPQRPGSPFRLRDGRSIFSPRVVLPELVWMLVLVFGYSLARLFVIDPATGYRNARDLWRVERDLGVPSEASFQHLLLHWPALIRLADEYYASAHFPVTSLFLFAVYVWRHGSWRRIRNAMTAFTAISLTIEAVVPMAPPRLVSAFGLVDTGRLLGQSVYPASTSNGLANQFAAMPSIHVGWALLVGVGVVLITRSRWRWLALLHPLATIVVVTVTANHYWADSFVAAFLVALVFAVPPLVTRWVEDPAAPRTSHARRGPRQRGREN